MNAHVLQHVPFEGPGSIEPWLARRGAAVHHTRLFAGDELPDQDAVDFLVIMGGPMSANDEGRLSWLRPEKEMIAAAIARGVPTLGICLGAQLIASALGARVYANAVKEIGWFPVQGCPDSRATFRFPVEHWAFHWHGETFDVPDESVRLAKSAACANQAFQVGTHALGLQFHLETTPESARALVEACRDDLTPGPYVQTAEDILRRPAGEYQRINSLMSDVLAHLLEALR